jgi:hypothetical protein
MKKPRVENLVTLSFKKTLMITNKNTMLCNIKKKFSWSLNLTQTVLYNSNLDTTVGQGVSVYKNRKFKAVKYVRVSSTPKPFLQHSQWRSIKFCDKLVKNLV